MCSERNKIWQMWEIIWYLSLLCIELLGFKTSWVLLAGFAYQTAELLALNCYQVSIPSRHVNPQGWSVFMETQHWPIWYTVYSILWCHIILWNSVPPEIGQTWHLLHVFELNWINIIFFHILCEIINLTSESFIYDWIINYFFYFLTIVLAFISGVFSTGVTKCLRMQIYDNTWKT